MQAVAHLLEQDQAQNVRGAAQRPLPGRLGGLQGRLDRGVPGKVAIRMPPWEHPRGRSEVRATTRASRRAGAEGSSRASRGGARLACIVPRSGRDGGLPLGVKLGVTRYRPIPPSTPQCRHPTNMWWGRGDSNPHGPQPFGF